MDSQPLMQKLAMALAHIETCQQALTQVIEQHCALAGTRPASTHLVITEDELLVAVAFEERLVQAQQRVEAAKVAETQAITDFLALLPKSIQGEMRAAGRAICASWTDSTDGQPYGPYAAYFIYEVLVIKKYADCQEFTTSFKHMRAEQYTADYK